MKYLKWTDDMTRGVLRIAREAPDDEELQERANYALLYLQIRRRPQGHQSFGARMRDDAKRRQDANVAADAAQRKGQS